MARYGDGFQQRLRLEDNHPRISGGFALDRGLWNGRRVAVRVRTHRGHAYQRSQFAVWYGTLDLSAGNADQIGVTDPRTGETQIIHRSRALDVYDLTRRLAPKRAGQ